MHSKSADETGRKQQKGLMSLLRQPLLAHTNEGEMGALCTRFAGSNLLRKTNLSIFLFLLSGKHTTEAIFMADISNQRSKISGMWKLNCCRHHPPSLRHAKRKDKVWWTITYYGKQSLLPALRQSRRFNLLTVWIHKKSQRRPISVFIGDLLTNSSIQQVIFAASIPKCVGSDWWVGHSGFAAMSF